MQIIASLLSWWQHSNIWAIFVYNGAFDIALSVQNVSGYTLLRDVKWACNKHSDIARLHYLVLCRFYYSLFIRYIIIHRYCLHKRVIIEIVTLRNRMWSLEAKWRFGYYIAICWLFGKLNIEKWGQSQLLLEASSFWKAYCRLTI